MNGMASSGRENIRHQTLIVSQPKFQAISRCIGSRLLLISSTRCSLLVRLSRRGLGRWLPHRCPGRGSG